MSVPPVTSVWTAKTHVSGGASFRNPEISKTSESTNSLVRRSSRCWSGPILLAVENRFAHHCNRFLATLSDPSLAS